MSGQVYGIADDQPLSDVTRDRLRVAPFAQRIADAIVSTTPRTGTVLGLHGPWGIGKSTILNFIRREILSQQAKGIRVIPFNPWWFGEQEDLVRGFFSELSAALGSRSERNRKLRNRLAEYATLVGDVPLPYFGVAKTAAGLVKPRVHSVSKAREDLEHLMSAAGGLTVVIMDDIDRLTSDEVQHVFRLIKSVGNLPGLVYVLAFDRDVVVAALNAVANSRGRDYLEKIVQVTFEIPLPQASALVGLFGDRIQPLFERTPDDLWSLQEYQNLLGHALVKLFTTPRSVIRLANALAITYPSLQDDVHGVDYIAIEALRVFAPATYDIIRRDPNRFVGLDRDREDRKALAAFYEKVISGEPEANRAAVTYILSACFPKVKGALQNIGYGSDWFARWDRERRICHPDHGPAYFEFQLPDGAFHRSELRALADELTDRDRVAKAFVRLSTTRVANGGTRAGAWLDELRNDLARANAHDSQRLALPGDVTPDMLFALALGATDAGDTVLSTEPAGGFTGAPPIWRVLWLIRNILRSLSRERRVDLLDAIIRTGRSNEVVLEAFAWFVRPNTSEKEEDEDLALLEDTDRDLLDASMRARLNSGVTTVGQGNGMDVHQYLRTRSRLDGHDAARAWLKMAADDAHMFVAFAEGFVGTVTSATVGDIGTTTSYRLNPRDLLKWMDRGTLENAFSNTPAAAWTSDRQVIARDVIERYLAESEDETHDASDAAS